MKRKFLTLAVAALSLGVAWAQDGSFDKPLPASEQDTISLEGDLQQIHVVATRATKSTPVAHTNLRSEQIARQNYGRISPHCWLSRPR